MLQSLQSMTGYGKAENDTPELTITIEVKSLNSKFLDINLRLPKEFGEKEIDIRNLLQEQLERGRLAVSIDFQRKTENAQLPLDEKMVINYYKQLKNIALSVDANVSDIFQLAVTMVQDSQRSTKNPTISPEEWQLVLKTLQKALADCLTFRKNEGKILSSKFLEYNQNIQTLLEKVTEQDPRRLEAVRERLRTKVSELLNENFDANRFEQELIYYIEKLDISEEKVRLQKHLDYLNEMLKSGDTNGKKLNFIAQEIGREINTIGSKANDAVIQRFVIEMKEELEKIKEQSANIL
jgi:uncharacterized protein (TIGR00255 family)